MFESNMAFKIFYLLIVHKCKSFTRSVLIKRKTIEAIIIIIGLIFFTWLPLIAIALAFPKIINDIFTYEKEIAFYCKFIVLIYFIIDLLIRSTLSKNISLLYSYLSVNIKKSNIIVSELGIKILNPFNFTYMLFFIPFSLSTIIPNYGIKSGVLFIIFIILVSVFSTYFILFIKIKSLKYSYLNIIYYLMFVLLLLKIVRENLISILDMVFDHILNSKFDVFIFLAIAISIFIFLCYISIKKAMYLDYGKGGKSKMFSWGKSKNENVNKMLSSLNELLFIEYRLIFRNNRTRKYFLSAVFGYVIFVSLLFFPFIDISNPGIKLYKLFAIIYISGAYISGFGIFAVSFCSSFFNLIATRPISLKIFFLLKYYSLICSVILSTMLSIFILLPLKANIIPLVVTFALWNMGVSSIIVLIFASYNIERCNLGKGVFLNSEAWGFRQSALMYSILLIPCLLFIFLSASFGELNAKYFVSGLSILFIIFHRYLILLISNNFKKRKYKILEIFRKDQG